MGSARSGLSPAEIGTTMPAPSRRLGEADAPLRQYLATTILKASFSSKNRREVVEPTQDRRFSRLSVSEAPEWCECVRRLLRTTLAGDGAGVLAGEFETQPGGPNIDGVAVQLEPPFAVEVVEATPEERASLREAGYICTAPPTPPGG